MIVMAVSVDSPIICPRLIGRASQLETIDQVLAQVRQGRGGVLLIAGEAGWGKSRLTAEIGVRAEKQGWSVVRGHCFENERGLPYAPVIDLLRAFSTNHPDAEFAQLFGPGLPEIMALLPELAVQLPNHASAAASELDKYRLFYALSQFLTQLTEKNGRPSLLVIVEDLHWSDENSLELLLYLARHLAAQPILFLFTYRSDETGPGLAHLLAQLDRERRTAEIKLTPLTRAQVDSMLQAIFNRSSPTQTEFLTALYSLTEGNPYFIEETLKSMLMAGDIFFDDDGIWADKPPRELHIPRSVRNAVQRRSRQLNPNARHVLTLAAVAGRRFDFSLLQHLVGYDEITLWEQMKELLAAQLIIEESADRFAFRHALTREAVYTTLLSRERRQLHATIGQTLKTASGETPVSDLAYHFFQGQIWDKAVAYSQRAGERAQNLYAPHAALQHFDCALEAASRLPDSPIGLLHFKRGQAHATLNNFDAAQRDYQTALNAARTENDHQTEWQILLASGDLWATRDYIQTGHYFQQAQTLARKLNNQALIAYTLNHTGNWQMNRGQPFDARRDHQEALAIFQTLDDPAGIAQTLDLLAITSYNCSDVLRAQSYYRQAIPLLQQLDDRRGLLHTYSGLALIADADLEVSDMPLAEAVLWGEKGVQVARDIGWRSGESLALICWGLALRQQGQYGPALELFQQALTLAEDIEHYEWTVDARCALGTLYLDIFALDDARQVLEQALAMAYQLNSVIWITYITFILAAVYMMQQKFDRAHPMLDELHPADAPARMLHQRFIQAVRVEMALVEGKPDVALAITDQLIATTVNLPFPNPFPWEGPFQREGNSIASSPLGGIEEGQIVPYLWLVRGRALVDLHRLGEAERLLQAAVEEAQRLGRQRFLWRIHATLGQLYLNQNRTEAAEQEITAARAVIKHIAASLSGFSLPQAGSLDENFVKQATAHLPVASTLSPQQQAKQQFGGLTAREREVAALVARGKSNRDIAEELVLSERTAERHIANIMTKLDFNSRTQIAAWVVEKRLGRD